MWTRQESAVGTVGTNLDVTPYTTSQKLLFAMRINAAGADPDATLKIYKDSAVAGNLIFDGVFLDRDQDGAISFPAGKTCSTKWIVDVSGGTGQLSVLALYR